MHDNSNMRQRCNRKSSPVKVVARIEGAIAGESIAERAESADWPEEVILRVIADGPLAAEESGFGGIVVIGRFREVDEKG